MEVPFLDLKRQYNGIKDEIKSEIDIVLDNCSYILGSKAAEFEEKFAKFCNTKYVIGVNSGTDALLLALKAYDIGIGDEVILPVNTFIATAEAVSHSGAKPVFVDMDPKTYNIDAKKISGRITGKTKAIIPVHLYGQMADMDEIMNIAKKHNLIVIEDACQAHGAEYKGEKAGSIGNIGCFSFYPGKNLGAYGDAGACVTNDEKIVEKIKKLRDHGSSVKYHHEYIGYNSRLDGIQGAVLSVKLKHLPKWLEQRRKNAQLYNKYLGGSSIITPFEPSWSKAAYHLYVIQTDNRDAVMKKLSEKKIACMIHYPIPIHMQKAYSFSGYKEGDFPEAEKYAKKIISLPMCPELTEEQIKFVCEQLKEIVAEKS